ncbi:hypothetical protein [Streptomyces xanthii]|uniref:Uncharacterized protein n=1 Tax=Streptomyces xanthii TaxID=2768069 RepID=A0A7H1B858_9ACTN|nr:hypothetical protein [Streptomyces xanthii]QNS04913.1 hypothetical protein IAG42_15705 [Streptomyces xanthii]
MTLRSDLAGLLAEAGILDVDLDAALADGHVRSAAYQRVVSVVASSRSRDRDGAIVATIVRDPDEVMSKTAVVALVDALGLKAAGPAEFRRWSAGILPESDRFEARQCRAFVRGRVHDWLLRLSVRDGHVPTPDELATVTDWMQRVLAEEVTSPAVLALLAESARRRKTRNIARNRAGSRAVRSRDGSTEPQAAP